MTTSSEPTGPLKGIRVLDVSTILAGPLVAQILGDFGADVIKIEHPSRPDGMRGHGLEKDGQPLWWKMVARNKKTLSLYLGSEEGAEIFKKLVADADVVIENFRPGTFEKWGLGYDVLSEHNPGLIMLRVTGFGQTGPYSRRPAFGTLVESMSGFAHLTGAADGPPHTARIRLGRFDRRDRRVLRRLHGALQPDPERGQGAGYRSGSTEPHHDGCRTGCHLRRSTRHRPEALR